MERNKYQDEHLQKLAQEGEAIAALIARKLVISPTGKPKLEITPEELSRQNREEMDSTQLFDKFLQDSTHGLD
jgi:hypothetical protein